MAWTTPGEARQSRPKLKVTMQTVLPSEFKRMMVLMLESGPHVVEELHVSGTAQTRHKLHTRLRHLKTGHVIERVFADNERVPAAPLETRRITYSYSKGGLHYFLDVETFDELDISDEQLGERRWFLKENEEYKALLLDGALLDIVLPPKFRFGSWTPPPPCGAALRIRTGRKPGWKPASKSWCRYSSPKGKPSGWTPPGRNTPARNPRDIGGRNRNRQEPLEHFQ